MSLLKRKKESSFKGLIYLERYYMKKPQKCRIEFDNGIVIEKAYYDGTMVVYYSNDVQYQISCIPDIPKGMKIIIE